MTSGRPFQGENAETTAAQYHDLSRLRGAYRRQHTPNDSSMSSNEISQHRPAALPSNHVDSGHQEPVVHQTPLHGRYVTENVVENKTLSKIVASLKRRLEELERVHKNLEAELENETKKRQQLEVAFEVQEREWQRKQESLQELLKNRDLAIEEANAHNKKLSKQLEAKSNEMFQMMRRMYPREAKGHPKQPPNSSASNSPQIRGDGMAKRNSKTPHMIRQELGNAENIRNRNTMGLALDFFGL